MVMDGPVIDYGSGRNREMGNTAADVREMDDLVAAWDKKKEDEGSIVGETFSLGDFVSSKI